MTNVKNFFARFSILDRCIWISSVLLITVSFLIFDRSSYLTLTASLVGVTSLIFCAKGDPIGQVLMIIFSIIYAIIALSCNYYGELMTYLCMTLPLAVVSLVSWLRNPYNGNRSEVKVNRVGRRELVLMFALAAAVTLAFYFILKAFNTANLLPSTFSVTTSFAAAYLTFRRSPFFAFGYAINDIVLIILWSLAAIEDITYISVVICFIAFFANDMYCFINWRRMERRQKKN